MSPPLQTPEADEYASTHGDRSEGLNSSPTSPRSEVSGTTAASFAASSRRHRTTLAHLGEWNRKQEETLGSGWPLLSNVLASEPEFEAFPRFREENIKILHYYMIEIKLLSRRLKAQEVDDGKVREGKEGQFAKAPEFMIDTASQTPEDNYKQWKLVQKLRKCLYNYNAALLQYAEVSRLPEPNSRNMDTFVKWLMSPDRGNFPIGGCGREVWGPLKTTKDPSLAELFQRPLRGIASVLAFWRWKANRTRQELVAPRQGRRVDALTRWIVLDAVPWCSEVWKRLKVGDGQRRGRKTIALLSEKVVHRATSALTTIAACMMPTGSIAVLTTAETTKQKLLYIGGFTLLFSIGLMLLTSEISRVQVFISAATFSAVLVVFVQNQ